MRTARAPGARLTKQERERLDTVLQRLGISFADWLAEQITGEDTMNTTELDNIMGAVLDITGDPAHLNFELRAVIKRECEKIVAAAVQQEREACATLAEIREMRYREHDMFPAYGMDGLASEAHSIAAAIRARNGRE